MAYILPTVILGIALALLLPRRQWREYYPALLFAALLGTVSDLCGVVFQQWVYYGPVVGGLSLWSDLGIAPLEGALFIRLFRASWRPGGRTAYLLGWAGVNALCEWFYVYVGWIGYRHWNPFRAFLYYIFFFSLVWVQEYWYNGTGRLRII
ncbi:MAG: CBO0543 family protein [Bacillota bacterium]|jgi:hypothetical protein